MKREDYDEQLVAYQNDIREYRMLLIESKNSSQLSYDKTVLTLSGGAFGISFTFITDIIDLSKGTNWPVLLPLSWVLWALSLSFVLFSYYSSVRAHDYALRQINNGVSGSESMGGRANRITRRLNEFAGIFFFIGTILISIFVYVNLSTP